MNWLRDFTRWYGRQWRQKRFALFYITLWAVFLLLVLLLILLRKAYGA